MGAGMIDNSNRLSRLLSPLWRRIRGLIRRGVVTLTDDSSKMQRVQLSLSGGETVWMERCQTYGLSSNPHPGAEAVVVAAGGSQALILALAIDDRRYRVTGLGPGEVALYDDLGNAIVLGRQQVSVDAVQHLSVTAPSCTIETTTKHQGAVTVVGNLTVDGNISASGEVEDSQGTMTAMRETYNSHTHTGNAGSPTSPPAQAMS